MRPVPDFVRCPSCRPAECRCDRIYRRRARVRSLDPEQSDTSCENCEAAPVRTIRRHQARFAPMIVARSHSAGGAGRPNRRSPPRRMVRLRAAASAGSAEVTMAESEPKEPSRSLWPVAAAVGLVVLLAAAGTALYLIVTTYALLPPVLLWILQARLGGRTRTSCGHPRRTDRSRRGGALRRQASRRPDRRHLPHRRLHRPRATSRSTPSASTATPCSRAGPLPASSSAWRAPPHSRTSSPGWCSSWRVRSNRGTA